MPWLRKHRWLVGVVAAVCFAVAGLRIYEVSTGTSVLVSQGSLLWIPIDRDTPWLPTSIRMALQKPAPLATAGGFVWTPLRPGFEVSEVPVVANGVEVDRVLVARIDPRLYRFDVRNDPHGGTGLSGWVKRLPGALLVMNGSYYGRGGAPATPVVIGGKPAGPGDYKANQGAFVARAGSAGLVDLSNQDWRVALNGADAAMVSYPLLLHADGRGPASDSGWLANRTFIAQDRAGRIILGTTKGGYFSLARLADFLKRSPMDVAMALDLDGGPVACQAIVYRTFRRTTCGAWEIQVAPSGKAKMLPHVPGVEAPMPMILAVSPR